MATIDLKLKSYDELQFEIMRLTTDNYLKQQKIDQLTNNWNELEEWIKEYITKNEKWYANELSSHDKQYYGDTYYNTNYMLKKFLDKMKEIKEGK